MGGSLVVGVEFDVVSGEEDLRAVGGEELGDDSNHLADQLKSLQHIKSNLTNERERSEMGELKIR